MYISFAVKQWTCRKTTMVVLTWKMGTSQFQSIHPQKTIVIGKTELDQETKLWPFPINPGILVQFMQGMGVTVAEFLSCSVVVKYFHQRAKNSNNDFQIKFKIFFEIRRTVIYSITFYVPKQQSFLISRSKKKLSATLLKPKEIPPNLYP